MRTVTVIQPCSLGDILILAGGVQQYALKHDCRILWPVMARYKETLKHIIFPHEVSFVYLDAPQTREDAVQSVYRQCHDAGADVLDLAFGFRGTLNQLGEDLWRSMGLPFDAAKYKLMDIPLSHKYDLQRKSPPIMGIPKQLESYGIFHDTKADGYQIAFDREYLRRLCPAAKLWYRVEDLGVPLWSWACLIEAAECYVGVDSAVSNMVDLMGLRKGRRFFHRQVERYTEPTLTMMTPTLAEGWEQI
jgi:hypothetical protein